MMFFVYEVHILARIESVRIYGSALYTRVGRTKSMRELKISNPQMNVYSIKLKQRCYIECDDQVESIKMQNVQMKTTKGIGQKKKLKPMKEDGK